MEEIKRTISALQKQFNLELKKITTPSELEAIRVSFLGRNGQIANLMTTMKKLPIEEKRVIGPLLNTLKSTLEQQYETKKQSLESSKHHSAVEKKKHLDVTAYKPHQAQGSLHLYTQIVEHLENIFISMGYAVIDGPEVETDYYNFETLNIPADHPARDMHDTF